MVKNIAIIPARGGSKRIPKKNIISFHNKPMIAWTIQAARESKIFDKIIVSTDNIEIADISKKYGAEVPFLRDKYIDDISPISKATIYSINQAQNYFKEEYDNVVQLMPNCPLRKSEDITNSFDYFIKNKSSSQISCFKFGWMNPWWALKLKDQNQGEYLFPEALSKRSQDLDDLYCPTGAIWIAQVKKLKKTGSFYKQPTNFFPIDWKSAVDIDNYEDLEMAKALFALCKINNKPISQSQQHF